MFRSFTEIPVWQKANLLSRGTFELTLDLLKYEDYGLTSKIRKSANSFSTNISEGFGRQSNKKISSFYIMPEEVVRSYELN